MKKNDDNKYIRIGIFAVVFLLGLFVSIIEKNGWIALIACVGVPLLYIPYGISDWKRKKQDNPPEKQNKPAKTAAAEAPVKKENTSEPPQQAKKSWQPYISMLRERYLNMSRYLLLRSWGHPTFPGEYDGGLAFIQSGEIWYFCVDHILYTLGEETHDGYRIGKDEFEHHCYRLPDDFFDNTTWENLEDKLTAVNWNAGSAVSSLFDGNAEDKAEIEKLFTHSPYRTMFKTAHEQRSRRGWSPDANVAETMESTLSIHIETGELTEKTRSIIHEFFDSESNDNPFYQYTVARSERAVSYDELASLVEASQDIAAEQYRGMTADNWRDFFDETR